MERAWLWLWLQLGLAGWCSQESCSNHRRSSDNSGVLRACKQKLCQALQSLEEAQKAKTALLLRRKLRQSSSSSSSSLQASAHAAILKLTSTAEHGGGPLPVGFGV